MANENTAVEKRPEYLLEVKGLKKYFNVTHGFSFGKEKQYVRAVDGVSFAIRPGETLGLVGESGCGKSTTGNCIIRLLDPSGGEVLFEGKDISKMSPKELKPLRRDIQMIFQDPYSSLDPRMRVFDLIAEPFRANEHLSDEELHKAVCRLMDVVGLPEEYIGRFPHEFSGGQRQRIGIARALAIEPQFIVCDEPISALDVSIQSQVINLLKELQEKLGLTYMFIAHYLNIVKYISDRIAVMYLGNLVELAPSDDIYAHTLHPYSQALLASVPIPAPNKEAQKRAQVLSGDVPTPINPKPGCKFAGRCPHATDRCRSETPVLREVRPNHFVACHLVQPE